ncbi:hypothetical protein ACHHYP_03816 [Achlya hypogyna]|uniref:Uncharacterized protein n=1 Tax=Achlya hypogyna TaxID=1202772 RepID=A0A1V9Z2Q2_ACHHY|nr:hypothetical protein ACHHYP_03816 [Achlya hypogyna]
MDRPVHQRGRVDPRDISIEKLRSDRALLKERLQSEMDDNELLRARCQREKDHFTKEYASFEARLRTANAALERNRAHVESTIIERDVKIDQLEKHIEMQTRLIESYRKQSAGMYSNLVDTEAFKKARRVNNQLEEDDGTCSTSSRENEGRVFALEQQVTKLFGQLQEERAAADALERQVETQKVANTKLMKAMKSLKRKLEQAQDDSSMEHMLQDLQVRFRKVSLEQEATTASLIATQDKLQRALADNESLRQEIAAWTARHEASTATIEGKDSEIQQLLQKVGKQDHYIADLEADYKTEQLQRQIERKNEELARLELRVKQFERDAQQPRESEANSQSPTAVLTLRDLDQIHVQALRVEHKADVIATMLSSYEAGGDMLTLLRQLDDPVEAAVLTNVAEGKQQVLMSLVQSQSLLDDMSDRFAGTFAKYLGAKCAMQ